MIYVFYLLFGGVKLGCTLVELGLCIVKLCLAGLELFFSRGKAPFGLRLALLLLLF